MSLFLFTVVVQILSVLLGTAIIAAFWKIRQKRKQLFAEISHADGTLIGRQGRVSVALYCALVLLCAACWPLFFLQMT